MTDQPLGKLYGDHLTILSARLAGILDEMNLDGLCVFAGPERLVARDDIAYPFRCEPWFSAFIPQHNPIGSVLKLVPGHRPELRYPQQEDFWYAPPAAPEGFWISEVDIRTVRCASEATKDLVEPGKRYAGIGDAAGATPNLTSLNDPELISRLDYFRAWKTPYEVECMSRASHLAVRGHRAAAAAFAAGATELELHEAFLRATAQRETELPYPAIVALGAHASILHYQHLDRTRSADRSASFLIDAGVSFLGYASDVTRTWARDADEFQALIASVDALQQTLCRELRASVDYVDLHLRAHELIAEVLVEHGLVNCAADEALERGLTRVFLPHGLGHLLGLQVHDAGGRQISPSGQQREPPKEHPALRLTRTAEPGFVVTVEPGLYFIPSLLRALEPRERQCVAWEKVERLMPFGGIRIEDNVLVEAERTRNLTREAFAAEA